MTNTETKRLLNNIIIDLETLGKQAEIAYDKEGLINRLEHTKYPYMCGYILQGVRDLADMLRIIQKDLDKKGGE